MIGNRFKANFIELDKEYLSFLTYLKFKDINPNDIWDYIDYMIIHNLESQVYIEFFTYSTVDLVIILNELINHPLHLRISQPKQYDDGDPDLYTFSNIELIEFKENHYDFKIYTTWRYEKVIRS